MMEMTPEQMAALSEQSVSEFVDRLIDLFANRYPRIKEVPRDEMRRFVREQMARAEGYGFELEPDFGAYVLTAWVLGPEFDRQYAPVQAVLNSPAYSRDEKREWLMTWTYELLAGAARAAGVEEENITPMPELKRG